MGPTLLPLVSHALSSTPNHAFEEAQRTQWAWSKAWLGVELRAWLTSGRRVGGGGGGGGGGGLHRFFSHIPALKLPRSSDIPHGGFPQDSFEILSGCFTMLHNSSQFFTTLHKSKSRFWLLLLMLCVFFLL